MRHRIARLAAPPLLPLLGLLLPGPGRRRRRRPPGTEHTAPPYLADATVRRVGTPALRGEDNALVRPYLLAHERREETRRTRRQRARRRALWCAVHGVDLGPRGIHGVEAAR
ncbi:hypothetical protein [Streptomyces sp. DH41]|uniref:hypothetical protein n=1 Tax=Streptomyces sp. DH41 TaxID=3040125 RepID=UPI002442FF41|nr:hypothetical protein [Streptomyces sp. DH41]MDG9721552.1 hypothetical protein [Streptomyces sp. DH41]